MSMKRLLRYPKLLGVAFAVASMLAGVAAIEAADFGAPGWITVILLGWLATLGLPTTLSILLLAAAWGRTEPFYGLGLFFIVAITAAVVVQTLFVKAVVRWLGGAHEN